MRKKITTTLVGGALAGLATLGLAGTAHAQGDYVGSYESEIACEVAGNAMTSGGFGTPTHANCVPNGGGPSDVKSWSLYVW